MKPLVEGLEKQYGATIEFRRLNVDGSDQAASTLASSLGVEYVPTFVFAKKDGAVADILIGGQTSRTLQQDLDAIK